MRDDPHLEILLPAARVLLAQGDETEKAQLAVELRLIQGLGAQRIMDEKTRVRWFQTSQGRDLAELAGPYQMPKNGEAHGPELDERDGSLLRLLSQGRSNQEIAEELHLDDAGVTGALNALYARIGTTSRAEATALAFRAV